MKINFVLLLFLLQLTIINAIKEEDDDDEPFDLSSAHNPEEFKELFLAQKGDPEKILKIFRALILQGHLPFDKILFCSFPAQKEVLRVLDLLAESRIDQINEEIMEALIQKFLHSRNIKILIKALPLLAKIIEKDSKIRDFALSLHIDEHLFPLTGFKDPEVHVPVEIVREVTKVIKALCLLGDKNLSEKHRINLSIVTESFLFDANADPEILKSVTWAYYYLTRPPNVKQYFLIDKLVKNHIKHLGHNNEELVLATLHVVESVVDKNKPDQIEMFLSNGFLSKVPNLLALNSHEMIVGKTLEILGQLLSKPQNYSSAIVEAGIIPNVIENMFHKNVDIKNAAAIVICFVIPSSSLDQIKALIKNKAIHGLCHVLKYHEKEEPVVDGIIGGYLFILKRAKEFVKQVYEILDECDGIHILYRLKKHQNIAISKQADEIIQIFDYVMAEENSSRTEL
uniref:Uncharacterized protein n=1 Tax=Panagrolaimus davidi TaxID=227884 RepID=A0A914NX27_9BILA